MVLAADDLSLNPTAPTPTQSIEEHLTIGKLLLSQGNAAVAQVEFRAVLAMDATHSEALRLMTKSQQQLDAAQASAQRAKERLRSLRSQAQEIAITFAREKASEQAKQEMRARQQVAKAREQQLKFLYNKGLTCYRQGDLQAAIDTFQQMVLLGPSHPLVRDAQRLMTQAETKQAGARARASARATPALGPHAVPELEQQLIAKRIEIETQLKYAKIALQEHKYLMAIELLQRVLVEDPEHRQAQQLLQQARQNSSKH